VTRREALAAGLLLGLGAGGWDAVAILAGNPRSFTGAADAARFAAGSVALYAAAGLPAGALLVAIPRRPIAWVSVGLAAWLFVWAGVRVHVRWFFGEPLTDPRYAGVNLALLAACAGAAWLFHRALGRRLRPALAPARLAVAALVAGAITAGLMRGGGSTASGGDAGPPPPGARDVLLVTWDTTRADHLSVYGYPRGTTPALDRLAREAALWTDLWAPIPLTNPSHASLFTGLTPREHKVRNNGTPLPADVATVVPALSDAGWRCGAFVSGIPLKAGLSGLAPGFSTYDDAFSPLERVHPMLTTLAGVRVADRVLPVDFIERRADRTADAAIAWLERTHGPRFLWVHFFDPHTPYAAAPPLRSRFARPSVWTAHGVPAHEWPVADYDAELRATDRATRRLLDAFERTSGGAGVVVMTADHGEGLGQHGELAHGTLLFAEDLRVPGIVAGVDTLAGIRTGLATTVRIGALARDAAGLERDPEDEAPADAPLATDVVRLETFAPEGRQDRSAVIDRAGRKAEVVWATGEERAFDLRADPGESRPRPVDEIAPDLRQFLTAPGRAASEALDPEVVRRLRALGYLH